ncbi:TPA: hypothetical protein KYJ86_001577 [Salmonella enterica subsp. enterica serovar Dublin]|nr:hypothetical protein [Salmonella enterica subsp. enterica serovar Dublin]
MNIKKILCLFLICGAANAHNIDPAKCNNEIQQDDVYWCLMDKYQQSVIALKKEEIKGDSKYAEKLPYVYALFTSATGNKNQ